MKHDANWCEKTKRTIHSAFMLFGSLSAFSTASRKCVCRGVMSDSVWAGGGGHHWLTLQQEFARKHSITWRKERSADDAAKTTLTWAQHLFPQLLFHGVCRGFIVGQFLLLKAQLRLQFINDELVLIDDGPDGRAKAFVLLRKLREVRESAVCLATGSDHQRRRIVDRLTLHCVFTASTATAFIRDF